jgi:hypothetical protein
MKIDHLCVLNHSSLETLGILHIHCLNVAVQLLFRTLLVVTLSRNSDSQSVRNTLDTCLPDLLVQLRIETNIGCALDSNPISVSFFPTVFHAWEVVFVVSVPLTLLRTP